MSGDEVDLEVTSDARFGEGCLRLKASLKVLPYRGFPDQLTKRATALGLDVSPLFTMAAIAQFL
jgi:hypothetical protein